MPEGYFTALGKVVWTWSLLESVLDWTIQYLGDFAPDPKHPTLLRQKIATIENKLSEKDPWYRNELCDLLDQVKPEIDDRHLIIHGYSLQSFEDGRFPIFKVTKGDRGAKLTSVAALDRWAIEIANITMGLADLAERVRAREREG